MRQYRGQAASGGIAIGPAWVYRPQLVAVERRYVSDTAAEWARLERALALSRSQLAALEEHARLTVGESEAEIFGAHQLFLEDDELLTLLRSAVQSERLNAEAAVQDSFEHYAVALESLEEEYFRARAQDVRDVRARVLRCLVGATSDTRSLTRPSIVVADDLTPSDTLGFDRANILGLCTVRGGPTSHTAILARGIGIPAVVDVALDIDDIDSEVLMIVDGTSGDVIIGPTLNELERARRRQAEFQAVQARNAASAQEPAVTKDGHRVEVGANVGGAAEAEHAVTLGAEGVGLFRTEFLYLDRTSEPSELEQRDVYRATFEALGPRPAVVRTLDIGGDKAVGYLGITEEPNPFLGWRAIRMIRERPDILENQLRALLVAAGQTGADLRIMLPMVSSLSEIVRAKEILDDVCRELEMKGETFAARLQFGIMVEVPAAALMADLLAPEVDFFSIGTNDLTQYTLAVDRTNERVSQLASPYHPAVLRLIAMTIRAAHAHGKWVGMCGELAGDEMAVPLLLGLGLDEFSMAAPAIPGVKAAIRLWTLSECEAIANRALNLRTAVEVVDYLKPLTPR
ncbi:MAG: phosphoenolpyruvate--protein phosphotransferase [Anaerolineae bacterium]